MYGDRLRPCNETREEKWTKKKYKDLTKTLGDIEERIRGSFMTGIESQR